MKTLCSINRTEVYAWPKKGECVRLQFLITQSRPHPDIAGHTGRLAWRNAEGLFPAWNNPASGIGQKYYCHLLAEGVEPPEDYNRTHFAGYEGNPGSFALRGKDIGELQIIIDIRDSPWASNCADIKVRGFDRPTPSEREFINAQIVPFLEKHIQEHREALREQARAEIVAAMREQVARAREELAAVEDQIETITT